MMQRLSILSNPRRRDQMISIGGNDGGKPSARVNKNHDGFEMEV
jgi:hypothetical protein